MKNYTMEQALVEIMSCRGMVIKTPTLDEGVVRWRSLQSLSEALSILDRDRELSEELDEYPEPPKP